MATSFKRHLVYSIPTDRNVRDKFEGLFYDRKERNLCEANPCLDGNTKSWVAIPLALGTALQKRGYKLVRRKKQAVFCARSKFNANIIDYGKSGDAILIPVTFGISVSREYRPVVTGKGIPLKHSNGKIVKERCYRIRVLESNPAMAEKYAAAIAERVRVICGIPPPAGCLWLEEQV
jgi:hypothetical protein